MATIVAAAGGGNWTTGATWVGGSAPTAADDALLTVASGNVTITTGSVCRSLNCTGYLGILTHNSVEFVIGDGTAGLGNVALMLVAGMTYTKVNATFSRIRYASTSSTQQTVTTAGKNMGIADFNGAGGSWIFSDNYLSAGSLILTEGTLDAGNKTVSVASFTSNGAITRVLTMGSGTWTLTGAWSVVATGLTLNTDTAPIVMTGNGQSFGGAGFTYNALTVSGSGAITVTGANTFASITRTGTAAKTDELVISGANQIVTGAFTVNGNSAINRVLVRSELLGTQRTITAGSVVTTNSDFKDIVGAGGSWNLSGATGGSGDCGGNSGITFTTATTQTWSGSSGGNWSANAWTSRVPLPQDTANLGIAFSASQTVTLDMPRMAKDVTWFGVSGTPVWATPSSCTIFGSITLAAGMSMTGTSVPFIFEGRGSHTITCDTVSFPQDITFQMIGGTMALLDSFVSSGFTSISDGTFNASNFNVTSSGLASNSSRTRAIIMGSGTWTVTGTGIMWFMVAANLTLTANTSTIAITNTSSSSKTFFGAGLTYYNISITTGGTGIVTINSTGSTINRLIVTGGSTKTIRFSSNTTISFTGGTPLPSGVAGNLITFDTSNAGLKVTLSSVFPVDVDYVSVKDNTASGNIPFYAGTHSTSVSGNTNWTFTDRPAPTVDGKMFLVF